eukprot:XP_011614758.1 PREDICTED: protein AKNAD1 [Takifugu rubripes]
MLRFDNLGQNTSDEEQEELPYDGGLGSNYSKNVISKISSDIHQLLLRHFPQEDLLQTDRLIQAETLPEVSLIESMDDTGCSLVSTHDSDSIDSNQSNSSASDPKVLKEKNSGSEGNGDSKTNVTSYTTDSTTLSLEGSGNSSVVNVSKQEKAKKDQQIPKVPLMRMRSFSDMKYGQGQVHYPLPDFSKISSKVKIPKVPRGRNPHSNVRVRSLTSCTQPAEVLSDGEQMTAELRDVVCQFMQKVEEFKRSVSHLSVSTTEQQDMLRSIMEAQDQLERRYISKKEEHRALEMQSYMGVSRNTGTFDPNRHVEGDIFRIGMHLEDIKEIIDRNICEQVSLPCSSSTPTSVKDILDMKPLCMSTPLPLPSLQEVQIIPICIIKQKPGMERTRSLRTLTKMSDIRQAVNLCLYVTEQEVDIQTAEVDDEIVRAETDSGFGSLYLNQTGLFQPNLLAGRVQPQNDALSNSDSEASCSNVQSVQSVATRQGLDSPQQSGVAVGVEQWVENTTKLSSLRLKEETKGKWKPSAPLHDHISDPILRCTVAAEESSSCLCSCSCKSEAIVALQSEVSRLREDLQECLVQLPLIAREVDYLASMTIADWISVNVDQSKKSVDSTDSDLLQCTEMSIGGRITPEFREGPKPPNLKHKQGVPHTHAKEGPQDFITEKSYSKEHRPAFTSTYHQKPLLQVNYGSSSSLPASYKIREPSELQNTKHHRKRSTQSDTALLPSDVYFQRTPSPASVASKNGSKESRSKRSKEDDIIMSLDMAIELARNMKQTTDKMAKRLSADLSESHSRRTPHNMQPLEGSKHGLL